MSEKGDVEDVIKAKFEELWASLGKEYPRGLQVLGPEGWKTHAEFFHRRGYLVPYPTNCPRCGEPIKPEEVKEK